MLLFSTVFAIFRTEVHTVRIMTSNIWGDYFGNPVHPRAEQLLSIYRKYIPDIIGFQEVTKNWYESGLFDELNQDYTLVGTELFDNNNFVPLAYKKNFTLLSKGFEYLVDTPDPTKAITWAVLGDPDTNVRFAVCNTHFWWIPGAEHDAIRVKNAGQLIALMKYLGEKYYCPVFAFGDMNCTVSAEVFGVYRNSGAVHLHDVSAIKEDISSHHGDPVFVDDGFYHGSTTANGHDRSIDHIIGLGDGFTVSEYKIVLDKDALDATDHSPVYADIVF